MPLVFNGKEIEEVVFNGALLDELWFGGVQVYQRAFKYNYNIPNGSFNYNLYTAARNAGWDGIKPLVANVTLPAGYVLGSKSTGSYAFDTGSGFPSGSVLNLTVGSGAYIVGRGGNGGSVTVTTGPCGMPTYSYGQGGNGGPALIARYPIRISNHGVIGGGGGGGGGYRELTKPDPCGYQHERHYGGGGGAGRDSGSGGSGVHGNGGNGTLTGGGAGGGGSLGAPGARGSAGSGGRCVVGNQYITWAATGTRYGAIVNL